MSSLTRSGTAGVHTRALDFLLAGVGGQGTLLAADILALLGMQIGCDVKKSELHGMSQRGGSVVSHVRWAAHVYSPLIAPGAADFVVAFERLEALRYLGMIKEGGTLLVNDHRIVPLSVTCGGAIYPDESAERVAYDVAGVSPLYFPAMALARDLGNVRVNNTVLLGALSAFVPVDEEAWLAVIRRRVPQHCAALNEAAFCSGRRVAEKQREEKT